MRRSELRTEGPINLTKDLVITALSQQKSLGW
jgi:hypothetical protein